MALRIEETQTGAMYNPYAVTNVNIAPNGLDFISLNIDDRAEPGDEFEITLSDTDPVLTKEKQLYVITDVFRSKEISNGGQDNFYITPFVVITSKKEFGVVTYTCLKMYKGFAYMQGIYTGVML